MDLYIYKTFCSMINYMLMGIYIYMYVVYAMFDTHMMYLYLYYIIYYMQIYIVFIHTCAYVLYAYVYVYCVTTYFVQPHFVCY